MKAIAVCTCASQPIDAHWQELHRGVPITAEIIELKVALARSGMNQSEAMEAAIALWVKQQGGVMPDHWRQS